MITTLRPAKCKSTGRMIEKTFPGHFKINQPDSIGYRFINLSIGSEIDEFRDRMNQTYYNSFLESFDLSNSGMLFDVTLSGTLNNEYLNTNSSGIKIKVVNFSDPSNVDEFYTGAPTRVLHAGTISLTGVYSNGHIIGLEYMQTNISGYGSMLSNIDMNQSTASGLGIYPTTKSDFNIYNNQIAYSGMYVGIKKQSYEEQGSDEIVTPLDSGYLNNTYPLYRNVTDYSGIVRQIDHYEPYHGWTINELGEYKAVIDYSGEYFFDSEGKKIYYRTAFNNPYGSGNYTNAYIELRNVPISGTLRIYDIDILNNSGNATEIPSSGIGVYYYQSPNMNIGVTGVFDPIYKGYEPIVPSGRGFGSIEGSSAVKLYDTSWSYTLSGCVLNTDTLSWVEPTGGEVSNVIKITNPTSRYLVEYSYPTIAKAKCLTSVNGTKFTKLYVTDPLYSLDSLTSNRTEVPFNLTKHPDYSDKAWQVLTFDGLTIRPNSQISEIDIDTNVTVSKGNLATFGSVASSSGYVGHSDIFVPQIPTRKRYNLNVYFDQPVSSSITESDISGSGNNLIWYTSSPSNLIYKIPYNGYYGKKIIYSTGDSYFYASGTFMSNNMFIYSNVEIPYSQNATIFELNNPNVYLKYYITSNGNLKIRTNNVTYNVTEPIVFDSSRIETILHVYPDYNYTSNLIIDTYIKHESNECYKRQKAFTSISETIIPSGNLIQVAKNASINIGAFRIYSENETWQF